MTAREQAARLVTLRVVKDWVAAEERDLRTAVAGTLVVGERVPALLGPESLLGFVQKVKGREAWTVTDSEALLDWTKRHAATEVVVTQSVRPSFVTAVLNECKTHGGWISPDGELLVPDGVELRTAEPTITVKPTAEADGLIREALASRRIALDRAPASAPSPEEQAVIDRLGIFDEPQDGAA